MVISYIDRIQKLKIGEKSKRVIYRILIGFIIYLLSYVRKKIFKYSGAKENNCSIYECELTMRTLGRIEAYREMEVELEESLQRCRISLGNEVDN